MFNFFRENVIMVNDKNNYSFYGDIYQKDNIEKSNFRDFIINHPEYLSYMSSNYSSEIEYLSSNTSNKLSNKIFINITCPKYIIPFMMNITFDNNIKKESNIFQSFENRGDSVSDIYLRKNILNYNLTNLYNNENNILTKEELPSYNKVIKNKFISLLPDNIREYLLPYVEKLFVSSNDNIVPMFSFDGFFKRLAIFTVLNEFLNFKSDMGSESTLKDFIETENIADDLNKRFHTGDHTNHNNTQYLIDSLFSIPGASLEGLDNKRNNYVNRKNGTLDLWKYFVTNILDELSHNAEFYNKVKGENYYFLEKDNNRNIESFEKTRQSDVYEMVQCSVSNDCNERTIMDQSEEISELIRILNTNLIGGFPSRTSNDKIYNTVVTRSWVYDLQGINITEESIYYQIPLYYFRNSPHNPFLGITRDYSKERVDIKIYVTLFSALIHIAKIIGLESKENIAEYRNISELVFNSDLLKNTQDFNYYYHRVKEFSKNYLEKRSLMPTEMIMGICGIKAQ